MVTVEGSGKFPGVARVTRIGFDDGKVSVERVRGDAYRLRGSLPCLIHYVDDDGKAGTSRQEIGFQGEAAPPWGDVDGIGPVEAVILDVNGDYRFDSDTKALEQTIDVTVVITAEVPEGKGRSQLGKGAGTPGWAERLENLPPAGRGREQRNLLRANLPPLPPGGGSAWRDRWMTMQHPVPSGEPGLLASQVSQASQKSEAPQTAGPGGPGAKAVAGAATSRGEQRQALAPPIAVEATGQKTATRLDWENPRVRPASGGAGFAPSWRSKDEYFGWEVFQLTTQDTGVQDRGEVPATPREKGAASPQTRPPAEQQREPQREQQRVQQRDREWEGREKERARRVNEEAGPAAPGIQPSGAEGAGGPGVGRRRVDDVIVWESWPKDRSSRQSRR